MKAQPIQWEKIFANNMANKGFISKIQAPFIQLNITYIKNTTLDFHGVQVVRIHLPMEGTQVQFPIQEDSTCCGASKPVHRKYWAGAREPGSHSYWSCLSRACALQQERPPQWEVCAPQCRVAPDLHSARQGRSSIAINRRNQQAFPSLISRKLRTVLPNIYTKNERGKKYPLRIQNNKQVLRFAT